MVQSGRSWAFVSSKGGVNNMVQRLLQNSYATKTHTGNGEAQISVNDALLMLLVERGPPNFRSQH